ncbi:MAG: hypothetical protein JXA30_04645 [Deltaproteobacteria bacterium]|nr:hypothetical protein [Deltaproteobacteria bacterium]
MSASSEFTATHAEFFEDGIDYVANPEALEGRWLQEWQRELEKRLEYSDFIGVITVNTLRTDIDPGRRTSYRLLATVDKSLYGNAPQEGLSLVVRDGQAGYETVDGNQRRILNEKFVVFVKWYETEDDSVLAHWHLSPASKTIVQHVQELIDRRDEAKSHIRVVTHEN